jgi:2-keto-4-pentenoate hydratase
VRSNTGVTHDSASTPRQRLAMVSIARDLVFGRCIVTEFDEDKVLMDEMVAVDDAGSREIARRLVRARLTATAQPVYPGALPLTLESAYACQDAAIALWPSPIAGWKVGKIPDVWLQRAGEERLVGPIFAEALQRSVPGDAARFAVIEGGFAAIEAEFVFRIGADAPQGKTIWSDEEALSLVDALLVGVELAGSPLPQINDLGPAVVVSDFGNNAGLVLGPMVPEWKRMLDESEHALRCSSEIDGVVVGHGRASDIAGGLMAALRFALARCAQRGLPLRAGYWVSTGAATGIHDIRPGQSAKIRFEGIGTIDIVAVPAAPRSAI